MSLSKLTVRGLAAATLLTAGLAAQAGIVTNASGYVTQVTGLSVQGDLYDVAFLRSSGNGPTLTTQAQALWDDDAHWRAAIDALLAELNAAVGSFTYVVAATDGSGFINNDFSVASTAGRFAHLRATSPGSWFVASYDGGLQSVAATFSLVSPTAQVPEPGSLALAAAALAGLAAARRRRT